MARNIQKISINDRFEHWLVLDVAPNKVSSGGTSRKAFKCICDCGTIRNVSATQLRNGKSKNCGCSGSYLTAGEQHQEWTVIEKSTYRNCHGSQFYLCKCSCGVTREVRMADLLNGKSNNCGHSRQIMSKGAAAVKQFLVNNGYYFYQEYIFKDLPRRKYDFALYNKENPNIITRLIEFDGEQHCENSRSSWHSGALIQRDKEKNQYALVHNIPLIRIPHYKTSVVEEDLFGIEYLVKEE